MIKKSIVYFIFSTFCLSAYSMHEQNTIRVVFNNVTSSSDYCSFIVRLYPFDKQTVPGYPVGRLGVDPINRYLIGASASEKSYVEFGYFDPSTGSTTWFPDTCKIMLNKSGNITVNIHSTQCSYAYQ